MLIISQASRARSSAQSLDSWFSWKFLRSHLCNITTQEKDDIFWMTGYDGPVIMIIKVVKLERQYTRKPN